MPHGWHCLISSQVLINFVIISRYCLLTSQVTIPPRFKNRYTKHSYSRLSLSSTIWENDIKTIINNKFRGVSSCYRHTYQHSTHNLWYSISKLNPTITPVRIRGEEPTAAAANTALWRGEDETLNKIFRHPVKVYTRPECQDLNRITLKLSQIITPIHGWFVVAFKSPSPVLPSWFTMSCFLKFEWLEMSLWLGRAASLTLSRS